MKARQIKRLRKKISKKGYYDSKLRQAVSNLEWLNTFETFECSSNFVGFELAKHNREVYNKRFSKAIANLRWYRKKCGFVTKI